MIKVNISKEVEQHFSKQIDNIFKNGKLEKKKDNKVVFSVSKKAIDNLLQKKLKKFDETISLEKLILSEYDYMERMTTFIDSNKVHTKLSNIEKDYFLTLYSRLKKADYIKKIGVSSCLYCNRNYIFNFTKNNQQNATAQLDHFFDKGTYPYLAVCLYNLIPSCSTCNQRKSSKKVDILHPYYESFDKKVKFDLKINDSTFYHSLKGFKIDINTKDKKAEKSIEVFNLKQLYENHKDIVLELIQKEAIYNESYLDELLTQYEGILFKNREDLQRLISGGYVSDDEIGKRPLSKLVKDISDELGLR
ncbi:MAG: Unknown protein [uncultured Sulfurovum sp.]|uniref:HNH nuclease domain-containing protein n=1 Tax=uncultured Sulfurovum sp. TaxID=269237 RepID=A0A6S6SB16_9BACT|nr:MAG: Unknown protein [uncultured Sulfurovum sp.]